MVVVVVLVHIAMQCIHKEEEVLEDHKVEAEAMDVALVEEDVDVDVDVNVDMGTHMAAQPHISHQQWYVKIFNFTNCRVSILLASCDHLV